MNNRKPYPSDVTDEEWEFVVPYLTLMTEKAPQRQYPLREVFNGLRWIVRTGSPWRYLPGDFPPWWVVFQQTQRWFRASVFETMAHDLRELLRVCLGRRPQPSAILLDSRTISSTIERGHRAGYDGYKKKNGTKIHIAVDTLDYLLARVVTQANEQDRAQVEELAKKVQEVTGENVKLAYVDQNYTGPETEKKAREQGIELEVVKLPEAKKGFVLLPRRWVVERSFGWASRFRRLVKDYERLTETVIGMHFCAFIGLMLHQLLPFLPSSLLS